MKRGLSALPRGGAAELDRAGETGNFSGPRVI